MSADRVALVTGGSGGIGGALCRRLAADGDTVLVGYRSDRQGAEAVARDCAGKAEAVHVDVAEPDTVTAAVERAGDLGTLGVLVNNAGVSSDGLLLRLREEDLDRTLQVNLRGAVLASQAALRPMLRARHGRIISIASVVGLRGNAGQAAYAATKAGLIGFSKSLAREVARKGVTVNVVAPGFVATAMTDALSDAQREALVEMAPTGSPVTADDVAGAVGYLAHRDTGAVTGAVLSVDGGAGM